MNSEPVLISGAFVAILNALIALNVVALSGEQVGILNAALVAVLSVVVRHAVTPAAKS